MTLGGTTRGVDGAPSREVKARNPTSRTVMFRIALASASVANTLLTWPECALSGLLFRHDES